MALYFVTVYKNQLGIGGKPWDNSYEIVTNGSLETITNLADNEQERLLLLRAAGAIAAFETSFHLTTTYFNRVGVRTWTPDSTPYNGDELVTVPLSNMGERAIVSGQQALGLDDTLYVRRQPKLGQLGKLLYRGVLLESDSDVNAQGIKNLNPASPVSNGGSLWTDADDSIAEGLMDYREQGGDEWAFVMAHQPTSETVVARPIVSLVPAGIVPLKLNKKHYNRNQNKLQKQIQTLTDKLAVLQARAAEPEEVKE